MSIKSKDLLDLISKNLMKSKEQENLIIRSAKFLKHVIKNIGFEDDKLKRLIDRFEHSTDILADKASGIRDFQNFLCQEQRKAEKVLIESKELLKKFESYQIWLFENLDIYIDKALESKLKILLEKKTNG